jgi:hypothetical protein
MPRVTVKKGIYFRGLEPHATLFTKLPTGPAGRRSDYRIQRSQARKKEKQKNHIAHHRTPHHFPLPTSDFPLTW